LDEFYILVKVDDFLLELNHVLFYFRESFLEVFGSVRSWGLRDLVRRSLVGLLWRLNLKINQLWLFFFGLDFWLIFIGVEF
jgi:hypothetical protein